MISVNQDVSSIHDRLQKRKQVIRSLIPSKERIFAAGLFDVLFMAGIAAAVLYFVVFTPRFETTNELGPVLLVFLAIGLSYELMILLTHGTFGMFVMRIAYVHGGSGHRFDHGMYWEFIVSSIFINLKYSSFFEAYAFFSSPTNQTKAMEETGTYYVCIIAYNKLHKQRQIPFPTD